jgi:hypothetical protein
VKRDDEWFQRYKAERRETFFVHLIVVLIFVAIIGLIIWLRASIPCEWIDFMPASQIPARCFTVNVR